MPPRSPVDELLGILRTLSGARFLSDDGRERAEECRQILLSLLRDKVPEGRRGIVAERFMENWDAMEEELIARGVTLSLDRFAVEGDELYVKVSGSGWDE